MKKLFVLFLLFFVNVSLANDLPKIIIYESGDDVYFVTGDVLKQLQDGAKDTCLEYVKDELNEKNKTNVTKFYELLFQQCRESLATMSDTLHKHGNLIDKMVSKGETAANGIYDWIYGAFGSSEKLARGMYEACVISRDNLRARLQDIEASYLSYGYKIEADINKCINSIQVHTDENSCPLSPSVADLDLVQNLQNLDTFYKNKQVNFTVKNNISPNIKSNQVVIFNGKIMVACDNGEPVYIVKPAFSGYEECQDAKFQAYPQVGTTPSGVYLVQHDSVEKMTNERFWGKYRLPLIPAEETDTFGRANMYLHGTSDPDKRRSGGCISLGVEIDDFVESDWFKNRAGDLLMIVHKY